MRIVTHAGRAHRDEFLAVAIILSQVDEEMAIFREFEVTEEDRDNPDVWVVDVGGKHTPEKHNFDHHQLDGGDVSSLSQVGGFFDIDLSIYQWFKTQVLMDNCGPKVVADNLGITTEQMRPLTDPVGKGLLSLFEQREAIKPQDPIHQIMVGIGANLVEYPKRVSAQVNTILQAEILECAGMQGLDGRGLDEAPEPKAMALVKKDIEKSEDVEITFSISKDPRNGGLALFRYDEESLDFSTIDNEPEILFAHKAGFLATTKEFDAPWESLIEEAKI